jgi:hypothetical protein
MDSMAENYARWQEERRTSRRTIADALDAVAQDLAPGERLSARIKIGPLQLPSGKCTALVKVVFTDLGCIVALPTAAQFRARVQTRTPYQTFEISRLDDAEVRPDGSVVLLDGTRLRAVEVIPTYLRYVPSELDLRILRHVIELTQSHFCYRSIREGLPEQLQSQVPDVHALDYARVRRVQPPILKVIRAYIQDHDRELKVSDQKIADALATCGVRIPKTRRRASSKLGRAACHN